MAPGMESRCRWGTEEPRGGCQGGDAGSCPCLELWLLSLPCWRCWKPGPGCWPRSLPALPVPNCRRGWQELQALLCQQLPGGKDPSSFSHPPWAASRTHQERVEALAGPGRTWQCHSGTPGPAVRTHCSAWPSCPCPSLGAPCPGNSSQAWGWASQKRNPPAPSPSPKMRSRWDTTSRPPPCHPLPGGCVGEGRCPLGTVALHGQRLVGGRGPPKAGGSRLQARWAALGWAGGLRGGRLGVPRQHPCSAPVRLLRHPRGS